MKHKFFLVAFLVLLIYQVARFVLSIYNPPNHENSYNFAPEIRVGELNSPFKLSLFSGLDNVEEQKKRKEWIGAYCSKYQGVKSLEGLNPRQKSVLLKHIIVSEKYKFLYCYTPKVACSNWKKVVKVLNGEMESLDVNVMDHAHGINHLSDYSRQEIEYKLKHYFKFMFTRNPLERLLSGYRNKFGEIESNMRMYGPNIIGKYRNSTNVEENYRGKIPGDDVSFEEYVRFLIDDEPPEMMNEHWAPMVTLCHPCIINYDFVGSYDHLYDDSEEILRHVGAPNDLHFPARQSFYSPTTVAATAYFYSLVQQKHLDKLFNKYNTDFKLFSYPLPAVTTPVHHHL